MSFRLMETLWKAPQEAVSRQRTATCQHHVTVTEIVCQHHATVTEIVCQHHVTVTEIVCQHHVTVTEIVCQHHVTVTQIVCQHHVTVTQIVCPVNTQSPDMITGLLVNTQSLETVFDYILSKISHKS